MWAIKNFWDLGKCWHLVGRRRALSCWEAVLFGGPRMYWETKTKSKTRKNQVLLTNYRGNESGGWHQAPGSSGEWGPHSQALVSAVCSPWCAHWCVPPPVLPRCRDLHLPGIGAAAHSQEASCRSALGSSRINTTDMSASLSLRTATWGITTSTRDSVYGEKCIFQIHF